MPPRYAYWTIIVDDQPTAFRAGALDDIMPTFNRLKEKQPTAKLMWFQSGKLWPSRIDAREAMQVRGERGRYSDPRQDGGDKTASRERPKWKSKDFSNPKPRTADAKPTERPEWKPRGSSSPQAPKPSSPGRSEKPEWGARDNARASWKPKGASLPEGKPEWKPRGAASSRPQSSSYERTAKPAWKPKDAAGDKPSWKPKGAGDRPAWKGRDDSRSSGKPEWKPKGSPVGRPFTGRRSEGQDRPEWKSKTAGEKPEWKPKGTSSPQAFKPSSPEEPKRKWIPKAEYKKLTGTEAKRDEKWRPGGEHKDPRQKYIDAKKAKWGRFKQAIRSRAKKKS